jgi:hypothetical protein
MSKFLDALDAALGAFQAAGITDDGAGPLGSDPQESVTVPLGATMAPTVAPLESAENRRFSTRATGATANHDIQPWEIRTNENCEKEIKGAGTRARAKSCIVGGSSGSSGKTAGIRMFHGGHQEWPSGSSGTMTDSCGIETPQTPGKCFTGPF